jgi:mannose/cellobiose epimerase-like protein (N-acyl-D-glucosamine 2-epimerase family)
MKRRQFIGTVAAVSCLPLDKGRELSKYEYGQKNAPSATADGRLAGKTLEELRDELGHWLFDDYIPFHDKYVVDHQYGGFTLHVGWNGPTASYEKSARYFGRGIWTYSFLYNKVDSNPKHYEAAQKAVDFILRFKPSGDQLWPNGYSREGMVTQGPPDRIYEDLFIANGLAEFSKSKGNEKYWDLAKEIMFKCVRLYDRPGYFEAGLSDYLGKDAPRVPGGTRLVGHWFCLLNQCTTMLESRADKEVEALADRCLEAILEKHYNKDFDLINEVLDHDFGRRDEILAQFVYTGHAIETLWMVLYEAVRRKDKALFDRAAESFKRHCEVAWDDVYGGLFRSLNHVDKNLWAVDKVGWLQQEGLIGSMCLIEHTGDPWARNFFAKLHDWVMDKFPLKKYGYPLWIDGADRKVTFNKGDGTRRAENFHYPRYLMLNLLAVERIIKRGGGVSGVFS